MQLWNGINIQDAKKSYSLVILMHKQNIQLKVLGIISYYLDNLVEALMHQNNSRHAQSSITKLRVVSLMN